MLTDEESSRLKGLSVLVVEDETLIALHVLSSLSNYGCRGSWASTLQKALAVISTTRFAMALLDVEIQNQEVFPVAALLEQSGTKIAFISGHMKSRVQLNSFGHRPFLTKPINAIALERILVQLASE